MEDWKTTREENEYDEKGQLIKSRKITEPKEPSDKKGSARDWVDLIVKSASLITIAIALLTYFNNLSAEERKQQAEKEKRQSDSIAAINTHLISEQELNRQLRNDSLMEERSRETQKQQAEALLFEYRRFNQLQANHDNDARSQNEQVMAQLKASIDNTNNIIDNDRKKEALKLKKEQYENVIDIVNRIQKAPVGSNEYADLKNLLLVTINLSIVFNDDFTTSALSDYLQKLEEYATTALLVKTTEDLDFGYRAFIKALRTTKNSEQIVDGYRKGNIAMDSLNKRFTQSTNATSALYRWQPIMKDLIAPMDSIIRIFNETHSKIKLLYNYNLPRPKSYKKELWPYDKSILYIVEWDYLNQLNRFKQNIEAHVSLNKEEVERAKINLLEKMSASIRKEQQGIREGN